MVRVGISVEGTTEERFMRRVLQPYLLAKQVVITAIPMHGNVSLDHIKAELQKIAHSFDYVSTFYDFYGFTGKHSDETRENLQDRMTRHVHASIRSRFIPYIQMYEYEGILFTSPVAMQEILTSRDATVPIESWACNILSHFGGDPEAINDSPQTAPSKRLAEHTYYRKTTHGPNIADLIGVESLRKYCAGFDEWVTQLEQLAPQCTQH